ncbi:MAG: chemotaxis protein CheW [Treponema sp.]|nr:chemotaxis protein CheW [Treponema sp.]
MGETTEGGESFMAVTFEIADTVIGIDAGLVEEIVRVPAVTPVRGAEAHVLGIVNLRGRIVTVLDVSMRLGLGPAAAGDEARILVTTTKGESIGALVPRLADVLEADRSEMRRLPGDLKGAKEDFFVGVFEKAGRLVALLDPEKALGVS